MSILVLDDDRSVLAALSLLLKTEGFLADLTDSPEDAIKMIEEREYELALVDLNYKKDTTSGKEGIEMIKAIRALDEDLPIIAMTAWSSVSIAVEAMQLGASDFIEKPWDDNNRLTSVIRNQIRISEFGKREKRLSAENKMLKEDTDSSQELIAKSEVMHDLLKTARKVADSMIPVLITGENGTGKSLLASYIHSHSSKRRGSSIITVNMGGIIEGGFESEMFGHVKGAFTDAHSERMGRVELAQDGTLFMDEISNMPLNQQAKVLRLLEEKQYEKLGSSRSLQSNARIISATNVNLDELVRKNGFRQDLLYRLNGISLRMPALRDRREDIVPLMDYFLNKSRIETGERDKRFSRDAYAFAENYPWPGNIREMKHVVDRAVLLSAQNVIETADLQLSTECFQPQQSEEDTGPLTLEQAEYNLIKRTLIASKYQIDVAATTLGLSRSALYRRVMKFNLHHKNMI